MRGRVDVEALAFAAGVKPAIRRAVEPARAEESAARLASLGGIVRWSEREVLEDGRPRRVMYVARTAADAEALRAAEADVLPGTAARSDQAHVEVGARLGFPPCCVAAFAARVRRGVDVLPGVGRGFAEDFVAARDAWSPDARAVVNPLWMRHRVALVSFYPCAFDCAAALRLAEATRDLVAQRDRALAAALVAALSGSIVLSRDGARVELHGDVASARPHDDGQIDPADAALADALSRGALQPRAGRAGPAAPLRVDFSA